MLLLFEIICSICLKHASRFLFITKSDILSSDRYAEIDQPEDVESMIVSSVSGYNIKESIQEIKKILELWFSSFFFFINITILIKCYMLLHHLL